MPIVFLYLLCYNYYKKSGGVVLAGKNDNEVRTDILGPAPLTPDVKFNEADLRSFFEFRKAVLSLTGKQPARPFAPIMFLGLIDSKERQLIADTINNDHEVAKQLMQDGFTDFASYYNRFKLVTGSYEAKSKYYFAKYKELDAPIRYDYLTVASMYRIFVDAYVDNHFFHEVAFKHFKEKVGKNWAVQLAALDTLVKDKIKDEAYIKGLPKLDWVSTDSPYAAKPKSEAFLKLFPAQTAIQLYSDFANSTVYRAIRAEAGENSPFSDPQTAWCAALYIEASLSQDNANNENPAYFMAQVEMFQRYGIKPKRTENETINLGISFYAQKLWDKVDKDANLLTCLLGGGLDIDSSVKFSSAELSEIKARLDLLTQDDVSTADFMQGVGQGYDLVAGEAFGPARHMDVANDRDTSKILQGDIMFAERTLPEWTLAYPKIAGIVTMYGGRLSHPAIIAREYGIPCISGLPREFFDSVQDGEKVRIGNGLVVREEFRAEPHSVTDLKREK